MFDFGTLLCSPGPAPLCLCPTAKRQEHHTEVHADCARDQSQVGLGTELGLRTYPRVMLTLVELPFSSFTVGGTVRLTVDSGKTQGNDMSLEDRELSHRRGGPRPLPSELTSPDPLIFLLPRCTSRLPLGSSHLCTRARLPHSLEQEVLELPPPSPLQAS